jgi:NAD(P)-dependent dehydrogenase (short-subunit alcohol dehydrogenase family)
MALLSFDERVVIVTGAGGGMGRGHARLLAARGARVVVNDIRAADDVVAEIVADGGSAIAVSSDISTTVGAEALVQKAVENFGRIDAIVNNAGIAVHCTFEELTPELFDRTMKVNTYGPFYVTKAAWPYLVSSDAGRVVMIASKAAITGAPNLVHYGASKGAILGLTRQLAFEGQKHGICVNAVNPAAFTQMSRDTGGVAGALRLKARARIANQLSVDVEDEVQLEQRSGEVVSAVVAWLCHPECSYNGEFFKAEAGEASRLSYAMATGINEPDLTIEVVSRSVDRIMDLANAATPPAFVSI